MSTTSRLTSSERTTLPYHYGLATMRTSNKKKTTTLSQEEIDQFVVSQANDDSAWEAPIPVKRSIPATISIPGELAARAAFFAKVHHEPGMAQWIERIVRERVELAESAFTEAKKQLPS